MWQNKNIFTGEKHTFHKTNLTDSKGDTQLYIENSYIPFKLEQWDNSFNKIKIRRVSIILWWRKSQKPVNLRIPHSRCRNLICNFEILTTFSEFTTYGLVHFSTCTCKVPENKHIACQWQTIFFRLNTFRHNNFY